MLPWIRRLFRKAPATIRRPSPLRPRLEALEDRCLLSAGNLDPTFGAGAGYVTTSLSSSNDVASAILIQSDGKIIAAGSTQTSHGSVMSLARYNTDGTLDTSFGSSGEDVTKVSAGTSNPLAAALYPTATTNAGKIVEAGGSTLARFNSNGTLDTSFGSKGTASVGYTITGVVVESNGDVVAAGDNGSSFELTRFLASGKVDTTFGSNGTATLAVSGGVSSEVLSLQPDGKLVVGGEGSGTSSTYEVARFSANGALDTTFGSGSGYVTGSFGTNDVEHLRLAIDPSTDPSNPDYGKIVAVATINGNPGGVNSNQVGLARFNSDGSLDTSFGTSGEVVTPFSGSGSMAWAAAIESDGKVVVGGQTLPQGGGSWEMSLLRYDENGTLDSSFGSNGVVMTPIGTSTSRAWGMAIQPDGRIVAAGSVNGSTGYDFVVARYLASEPQIGSFAASPSSVTAGSSVTLTASSITDGNPSATITGVTFYYYDANNNKITLGSGTQSSPGTWTLTSSSTFGLTAATYKLYAQATDSDSVLGDPTTTTLTVS